MLSSLEKCANIQNSKDSSICPGHTCASGGKTGPLMELCCTKNKFNRSGVFLTLSFDLSEPLRCAGSLCKKHTARVTVRVSGKEGGCTKSIDRRNHSDVLRGAHNSDGSRKTSTDSLGASTVNPSVRATAEKEAKVTSGPQHSLNPSDMVPKCQRVFR